MYNPLTFHAASMLYLPRIKVRKEKNLLNKDTDEEAEQEVEEVCQIEYPFLRAHSSSI